MEREQPGTAETSLMTNKEKSLAAVDDVEEESPECGIGSCKPRPLQRLANIASFVFFYSINAFLFTTLSAYINSQVTSLERQFGLSSSQTGVMLTSDNIGHIIVVTFIGYFTHGAHRPRVMAAAMFLYGISGILACTPHFLFGAEVTNSNLRNVDIKLTDLSYGSSTRGVSSNLTGSLDPEVDDDRHDNALASVVIISVAMALQGMTKAPRHPFIFTYVDENVKKTRTGFYMGIIISFSIFGPAAAFGLGSLFSSFYVTLEDTPLYPRHPEWVGAWWLGFLLIGVCSILASLPIFFFPRTLNKSPRRQVKRVDHKQNSRRDLLKKVISGTKGYFLILVSLCTNPVYLSILASNVFNAFALSGYRTFFPKYMENQFGIPAWKANLIIGLLNLSLASVGTFVGGFITKRFIKTSMNQLVFLVGGSTLSLALISLGFAFGCSRAQIVGLPGSSTPGFALNGNCSGAGCGCSDTYLPVCGADNINYFSPCHAGCPTGEGPTYTNCSVVGGAYTAREGLCEFECPYLYHLAAATTLYGFFLAILITPTLLVKYRCVSVRDKPMSVSFSTLVLDLFGWLMGPIVYGGVIDSACLVWKSSRRKRNQCALYDADDFRYKMFGYQTVARTASLMFLIIALVIAKKKKYFREQSGNENEVKLKPATGCQ